MKKSCKWLLKCVVFLKVKACRRQLGGGMNKSWKEIKKKGCSTKSGYRTEVMF